MAASQVASSSLQAVSPSSASSKRKNADHESSVSFGLSVGLFTGGKASATASSELAFSPLAEGLPRRKFSRYFSNTSREFANVIARFSFRNCSCRQAECSALEER